MQIWYLFNSNNRQFLKEGCFEVYRKDAHFTVCNNHTADVFHWIWHLNSFPIEHHSIIKILNFHKQIQGKNEFVCQRGIVFLPEINMFTFISLLLRISSRFTCQWWWLVAHSQFIYFVWSLRVNDVNVQFILILPMTRSIIAVWVLEKSSSLIGIERCNEVGFCLGKIIAYAPRLSCTNLAQS